MRISVTRQTVTETICVVPQYRCCLIWVLICFVCIVDVDVVVTMRSLSQWSSTHFHQNIWQILKYNLVNSTTQTTISSTFNVCWAVYLIPLTNESTNTKIAMNIMCLILKYVHYYCICVKKIFICFGRCDSFNRWFSQCTNIG